MASKLMTVGQLAKRTGLRPSALRFYEEQELLPPTAYSEGGYRLYDVAAEETLRFLLRAQRLGFSLADIRGLLAARRAGGGDEALAQLAEARYVALERQLTPLLIARHELAHLLQDLHGAASPAQDTRLAQLLDRICGDPLHQPAETTLDRLLALTGCELTSEQGQAALARLRGAHAHLWIEGEAYHILVVSDDPEVGAALEQLAQLEAGCAAHGATNAREVRRTDEGYLLVARGDDAFLYARLFMALEDAPGIPNGP
jgi:MerR family Zn(II)-responsive transcriptional regulator of zntA